MSSSGGANFQISAVPAGREPIATMIVEAFAAAGFGQFQQIAALANAIAESNLDPNAQSAPPDAGVGLFQLTRTAGLGAGHAVAELQDPATNIAIIVKQAQKFSDFANAASLQDAVGTFVRMIMRPADVNGAIARRLKIAQKLLP